MIFGDSLYGSESPEVCAYCDGECSRNHGQLNDIGLWECFECSERRRPLPCDECGLNPCMCIVDDYDDDDHDDDDSMDGDHETALESAYGPDNDECDYAAEEE